jgi:hypothetical protein
LVSSKFGHCIVFHSSIYSFWYYLFGIIKPLIIVLSVLLRFTAWLPLWYRQTLGHCIRKTDNTMAKGLQISKGEISEAVNLTEEGGQTDTQWSTKYYTEN